MVLAVTVKRIEILESLSVPVRLAICADWILAMEIAVRNGVSVYILKIDLRKFFSNERSYRDFMCKSISAQNIVNAEHYGYEAQSNQLVEECAELIQAVSKYRRARGTGQETLLKEQVAFDNLIEEIADVEIMLEQIKHLLKIPEEDLLAYKQFKINRTKERIEGRG